MPLHNWKMFLLCLSTLIRKERQAVVCMQVCMHVDACMCYTCDKCYFHTVYGCGYGYALCGYNGLFQPNRECCHLITVLIVLTGTVVK